MFVCAPDNVACLVGQFPATLSELGVIAGTIIFIAIGLTAAIATAMEG